MINKIWKISKKKTQKRSKSDQIYSKMLKIYNNGMTQYKFMRISGEKIQQKINDRKTYDMR